jgi:hypothetical protein
MIRIIGLIVVIGVVYLFLNWDEYRDDVTAVVEKVDAAAEQTSDTREAIKDKIEDLKK